MHALGLRLGPVELPTNLLLAPIAGYCDLAFRMVCREWGGVGLACTDLLSPQGLLRGTATSLDLAKTNEVDKPVGMQLYGSEPSIMAEGARWAVEHGATVVDINMGCPVDKVTKKDGGSKLLTNLDRAVDVARAVRVELDRNPLTMREWAKRLGSARLVVEGRAYSAAELAGDVGAELEARGVRVAVPLTCKMRLCWHTSDYEAGQACSPGLARMLADVGVVGVTVHGRTTEDKFQGTVRHEGIARVVEEVAGRIPVIGNGDVREARDAVAMVARTGCQGVMIGRGALSTPWLFRDAHAAMRGEQPPSEPTVEEKIETIRRFFELMLEQRDERYAMFQIRRRVSWFSKRLQRQLENGKMEGVKPFKEAMRTAAGADDVHATLDEFLAGGLRSVGAETDGASVGREEV
jgi:tRNA-dihydrouridine synthase